MLVAAHTAGGGDGAAAGAVLKTLSSHAIST